jgi:hypothetical protein
MPVELDFDPGAGPAVVTPRSRAAVRQARFRRKRPEAVAAIKRRYTSKPASKRKSNSHRRWRYEHDDAYRERLLAANRRSRRERRERELRAMRADTRPAARRTPAPLPVRREARPVTGEVSAVSGRVLLAAAAHPVRNRAGAPCMRAACGGQVLWFHDGQRCTLCGRPVT